MGDTTGNLHIHMEVDPSMEMINGVAHVQLSQHPGNLLYFLDDGRLSLKQVQTNEEEIVVEYKLDEKTDTITSKRAVVTNTKTHETSYRELNTVTTIGEHGESITEFRDKETDYWFGTLISGYTDSDGKMHAAYSKTNRSSGQILLRQISSSDNSTGNDWSGDDWDEFPSQSSKYTSPKVALPYRPMNGIAGSAHQPITMIRCNSSVSRMASIPSSGKGNVSQSTDGVNAINLVGAILQARGKGVVAISQANPDPDSKPYFSKLIVVGPAGPDTPQLELLEKAFEYHQAHIDSN